MAKSSVRMDITKMQKLVEQLKVKATIQVGVFADKSARKSGELTNAALAQIHEYGSPEHGLPARSMLHVPIHDHASEIMKPFIGKAEAFLAKGTLINLYKLIGVKAERVVNDAFTTGGYGKWPSLTAGTIWRKLRKHMSKDGKFVLRKLTATHVRKYWDIVAGNIGQGILIDTGQLRRSFASRVRMVW